MYTLRDLRLSTLLAYFFNGTGSFYSFAIVRGVSDDLAFDEVNHLFGDVGGVIGKALQVPGNEQQIDQISRSLIGVLAHGLFDAIVGIAV
jgi:hypothetical protein